MSLGVIFGLGLCLAASALAAVPAFPGAEGAGKWTVGGRGGRVIAVTNLNDSGPGSLRAAIESEGRRIVIFRTDGTIFLKSPLRVQHPYLTLAGHSAPGDGITLAGHGLTVLADQVIVRYLRFRPGDIARRDVDAVSVIRGRHIILDHISASWGVDEVLSVTPDARDVTVQWSLITESLHDSVHSSRQPHGKGSLIRGRQGARISFFHNLYAHHADRAPMVQGIDPVSRDPLGVRLDFRGNVIYDWGSVSEGWEAAGANRNPSAAASVNFVHNAYLTGPSTQRGWLPIPQAPFYAQRFWAFEELSPHARAHWSGNSLNGALWTNTSGQPDPAFLVSVSRDIAGSYFLTSPVAFSGASLPVTSAADATTQVLEKAGASLRRDAVDRRILEQVRTRSGGLIDSQNDVGGWPALARGTPLTDSDRDGLPDGWERSRGLDPAKASDAPRLRSDGYAWLENYHQQLLQQPAPVLLTVTAEGPGSATAATTALPMGGHSALSISPQAGHVVDRVLMNGQTITLTDLTRTPALWRNTTLHFVFARPRIALPAEFAKPAAVLIARDTTLNSGLGGMLHLSTTPSGAVSGTLWNGAQTHTLRGQIIARQQETPTLSLSLPRSQAAPLRLTLRFHAPGDLRGTLTSGSATAALQGWISPWQTPRQPLPPPQRGTHLTTAGADGTRFRLTASASGTVSLLVTFPDRRQALRSTRLGPDGQWLLWSPSSATSAPTHGSGTLRSHPEGSFLRLGPSPLPYTLNPPAPPG